MCSARSSKLNQLGLGPLLGYGMAQTRKSLATPPTARPLEDHRHLEARSVTQQVEPVAHRCNDRAEDVIQALFEGNPFKTVPGPFKLFWQCMRSKPGEEPTEPFYYLQLDPPKKEEPKLE
ncbi:hypothetical protein OPV22_012369 [Ensete ventricosum]|uniref:Hexokinase n=1 Tax=Ensete ventricosum TaxID=4639 RepID=A0AAV8R4R8_ENSVE|nr:hypothetical protein OPV22_012369 [Ensete ventricosum]